MRNTVCVVIFNASYSVNFSNQTRHFVLSLRQPKATVTMQDKKYQNDRRSVALCINVEGNGSDEVDGWGTVRSRKDLRVNGILPGRITSPSLVAN